MDLHLKDKTALITASTSGIGRALAEGLLKEGAHVVINGRSEDSVQKAIDELKKISSNVEGIAASVENAEGCQKIIEELKDPVDILINNFGIYEKVDFFDTDDPLWERFYQANVLSGVRLSRHFMKPMLERGWGRILFISSESGLNIPEDMIHYGMTKTAQLSLMRGLAKLTKGTEVTVNAILPGPTLTEGVEEFISNNAKQKDINPDKLKTTFFQEDRPSSLIKRFANPEEIAPMTALLCSPLSSLTNGSSIRVEGGIVDQIV